MQKLTVAHEDNVEEANKKKNILGIRRVQKKKSEIEQHIDNRSCVKGLL